MTMLQLCIYAVASKYDSYNVNVHHRHITKTRAQWEQLYNASFPGRRWGVELQCDTHPSPRAPKEESERVWARRVLHETVGSRGRLSTLHGTEISACNNPILPAQPGQYDGSPLVTYVETARGSNAATHQSKCSNWTRGIVLDDAQTLRKIENERFDFLMNAHVLEHIPDVLGALYNWLRVVRVGGVVMFVVPDPCDPSWHSGERARFATHPNHFLDEMFNAKLVSANEHEHLRENVVTLFGIKGHEAKEAQGGDSWVTNFLLGPQSLTNSYTRVIANRLGRMVDDSQDDAGVRVHSSHLHVWSWSTLQSMLRLSQVAFRKLGIPFCTYERYSTRRRSRLHMKEHRVVLVREPLQGNGILCAKQTLLLRTPSVRG